MKTHAYNSLYLEDAMNNLGTMLDCTVNAAQYDLVVFTRCSFPAVLLRKWRLEIPVIFRECRGWN